VAGVACGLGWAMLGQSGTIPVLYFWYGLAGLGAAFVYCTCIGVGLGWVPDRRGFALGVIAAGFGSGLALFIPILSILLKSHGYREAFLYTGIAQGLLIMLAAQFMGTPRTAIHPASAPKAAKPAKVRRGEDFSPLEMLTTPHFYVMYAMML